MRLHDISQPLGERTAVWPGDRAVEMSWSMRRDRGDSVNVAGVGMTVHAGTHADGPNHFSDGSPAVGELPLEPYIGPAVVVDATARDWLDVDAVIDVDLAAAERILFRTRDRNDPERFPERVAAITPALARHLGDAGVKLVGTDGPSVDPLDSKTLEAHHALAEARVAILENLVLTDVPPGRYTLVALPLRLVEADSSPVRAVLLEEG
jgi:arylformamidase